MDERRNTESRDPRDGQNHAGGNEPFYTRRDPFDPIPVAPKKTERKPKRRKPSPLSGLWWKVPLFAAFGFGALRAGMVLKSISSKSGGVVSFLETIKNPKARFQGKSRVNILLVGKDYNRDSKGMPITRAYFIDSKTGKRGYRNIARADTIVVMSCDLDNGKVSAISIPRDTRVTARDGKTGKINATYARGGSKLLRETVEDLTGIKSDYVIAIKPDAIREIVSILGGVDVETIDQMKYDDNWGNLHIDLPKGKQHLTGDQAVGFARFREVKPGTKHSAEEGDARRMARQQQLIRSMISQGKHPGNLLKADQIIGKALDQLEDRDISDDQIYALASIYRGLQPENLASNTLMGEGTTRGAYYFIVDPEKARAMVDWLINGNEEAGERITRVDVINATKTAGLARKTVDVLRDTTAFDANVAYPKKPKSGEPEPAEPLASKIVYYKSAYEKQARKLATTLGITNVIKEVAPDTQGVMVTSKQLPDVKIVLGLDKTKAPTGDVRGAADGQ